ncbi:DUF2637 domain-containing protein [Nocardiopsis quinghaiensis]|uniref:DUF2637 domain-containing protein n=1 Tax=Nocardiopsis quinghaiensis TaxID=464995 RepID=UPI00123AFA8E|nr:DUF2637 domain-containing protein [Nocardiopsis quinghaiensis]
MSESLPLPLWSLIAAVALVVTVLAVWAMRRLVARRPTRVEGGSGAAPLHGGYLVATAVIAAVALALILVAFTMSYAALYEAATWLEATQLHAINGGDLRFLFPLGIDAVIVYFLAMDLLMEWQGRRHPLNRWAAYALSAITIILNVSQGDGSTASYLGHAGPPIVIILIAEGVAAWVRHLAGIAHGQSADRIPVGRWVAHPLSTMKVARLMLGWGITSYPQALEREQRRQLAYAMLREQHGRTWRRHTPRHLRWMLDNGYDLDTAYELTRAMTMSTVAMTAAEVTALAGSTGHRRPSAPAHTGQERAGTSGTVSSRARTASRAQGTHSSSTPRARQVEETPPAEPLAPAQKRQRVRELLRSFPGITDTELARYINASPSTARRYRNEITHQRLGVDIPGHTPGQDPARRDEDKQREDTAPTLATARSEP